MKINTSKSKVKNKRFFFSAALLLLLILAVGGYKYFHHSQSTQQSNTSSSNHSVNYQGPTKDQIQNTNSIKAANSQGSTGKANSNTSDQPPSPTPISGDSQSKVQLIITAANQNESFFQIRTLIDAVTDSGTCSLAMTKAGHSVTQTTGIQPSATTSACKGFDVPITQLSPGDWHVVINFNNTSLIGTVEKDITIQ